MAFNGRPRKVMPEVGKEFPILNGMSSLMSGPPSAPASTATQGNPMDRVGILGSSLLQQQQQQPQQQPPPSGLQPPPPELSHQQPSQPQPETKESEANEQQPNSLTAIFRPDEDGEWKEKLRLAHEASEQAHAGQSSAMSGAASWERRSREDEDEGKNDDEAEVEEDEGTEIGEGESGKVWKAKRTLRKSVTSP